MFLNHQLQMKLLQFQIEDFSHIKTASSKHLQYNSTANYCFEISNWHQRNVLCDKVMVAQLVKKFPTIYGNWMLIIMFSRTCQFTIFLQDSLKYFPLVYAKISQMSSSFHVFQPKLCTQILYLHVYYIPCQIHPSWFHHLGNMNGTDDFGGITFNLTQNRLQWRVSVNKVTRPWVHRNQGIFSIKPSDF